MVKRLKLTLALAAIAVLTVPAVASAAALTNSSGKLVPAETLLTATSKNMVVPTDLGTIKCTTTKLPMDVIQNSGGIVKAVSAGFGSASSCTVEGVSISVSGLSISGFFQASGSSLGSVGLEFDVQWPFWIEPCSYMNSSLTFTYTSGNSSFHLAGSLTTAPLECGEATVSGDFALTETLSGKAVVLD